MCVSVSQSVYIFVGATNTSYGWHQHQQSTDDNDVDSKDDVDHNVDDDVNLDSLIFFPPLTPHDRPFVASSPLALRRHRKTTRGDRMLSAERSVPKT